MVRVVSLAVLVGALAACAAPPTWHKDGASPADFNQATARCRMRAAGLPYDPDATAGSQTQQAGRAMENLGARGQFMNDCLVAEGWTLY